MKGSFKNKKVLITGGLGFIGSNLAIELVGLGAHVTLLDAMMPDYGGNTFNVEPVRSKVSVNFGDVRNQNVMNQLVVGKDYIFHLAKQACHIKSFTDPFPDIDINIKGTAVLMEACKKYNPQAVVVYTGTRGQYGTSIKLPVSEDTLPNPKGIYEISNLSAEQIIKVYNDVHGIRSVLLRLTNIYGPRAQMKHNRYGVVNWFVRQVVDGENIKVFGDGSILRDFVYVDDAVKAIIVSAVSPNMYGQVYNVGTDIPTSFLDLAKTIVDVSRKGGWEFAEFSKERKAQEPGDFYSDISKIRSAIGWEPKTALKEGIERTLKYYGKFKEHYW